eukprot:scaffold283246_cov14-Tisochrysis_lutea.AAC.1
MPFDKAKILAQKCEQHHGQGQSNRLPERLCPLAVCVAREVRDVQTESGPERNLSGHGRPEHAPELPCFGHARAEQGRGGQHGAEPACCLHRPAL